jgi:hypothetical protein
MTPIVQVSISIQTDIYKSCASDIVRWIMRGAPRGQHLSISHSMSLSMVPSKDSIWFNLMSSISPGRLSLIFVFYTKCQENGQNSNDRCRQPLNRNACLRLVDVDDDDDDDWGLPKLTPRSLPLSSPFNLFLITLAYICDSPLLFGHSLRLHTTPYTSSHIKSPPCTEKCCNTLFAAVMRPSATLMLWSKLA